MTPPRRASRRLRAVVALAASVTLSAALPIAALPAAALPAPTPPAAASDRASAAPPARHDTATSLPRGWVWPVGPFRLERPFVAPPHAYGPGHRGVDVRPREAGAVLAPASGVIAFAGQVGGRALLTIDHGDGLVTTLEPVVSELTPGTPVERGMTVGRLASGGHTEPGVLHFGVRLDGEYINPLVLLGGVPRAVLLPCC